MPPCPSLTLEVVGKGSEKSDLSRAGNWRLAGETVGVFAADQALWQKVSQETCGKILTSGDPKPVDKAVSDFMDAAEVTYHLLPIRDHGRADPPVKDPKPPKKPPKNPDRKPGGGDRDVKAPRSISQMDVSQRMTPTRTFASLSIAKPAQ